MTRSPLDTPELRRRAADRVTEVAQAMNASVPELSRALLGELAEAIPELRGDQMILDLLHASVESNVETFLHIAQYDIAVDEVSPPSAAMEYARRLAQRGTSSTALLRAYRLGQSRVLGVALDEIARAEPDGWVAYTAVQTLNSRAFAYVDRISEHVVAEYEVERERWLANRNTVRATMLSTLLAGNEVDVATGEQALGYRLRQNHLGVVLWAADRSPSTSTLRRLEQLLGSIAGALDCESQPLFIPQDRSLGWGWIPLGRAGMDVDVSRVTDLVANSDDGLRAAFGTPGAATSGFRSTHHEAHLAHTVATIAADRARPVTTYHDAGVRAAALLASDLPLTRELVATSLGGLAADDDSVQRLRETLQVFLGEQGSYVAAAEKVHLHKNTVKYRVDKAIALRERPIDDDRFNLELALVACEWLGRAVLTS